MVEQIDKKLSLAEFWKRNYNLVILPLMFSCNIVCFGGIKDFFVIPIIGSFLVMNVLVVKALWYELRKKAFSRSSYLLVLATTLIVVGAICVSIAMQWFNPTLPSVGVLLGIINPIFLIILAGVHNKQKLTERENH